MLLAASLVAVILHHFLEALFAALRKFPHRFDDALLPEHVLRGHFAGLCCGGEQPAESIVIGYGAACLISAVGALLWKGRALAEVAAPDEPLAHREFWPPLVRFAVWVWVINLFCHLFAVVDRYMLVHWSGLDNDAALALVGHYHASRIVPLLFLSVADLLAGVVMPYLSHDWEAGNRERVSDRLNLVLKLTSLVMLAGGRRRAVVRAAVVPRRVRRPLRRRPGRDAVDAHLLRLVRALDRRPELHLVRRETKLGAIPLAVGLVVNIGLNLVLIPAWGLSGPWWRRRSATGARRGRAVLDQPSRGNAHRPRHDLALVRPGRAVRRRW